MTTTTGMIKKTTGTSMGGPLPPLPPVPGREISELSSSGPVYRIQATIRSGRAVFPPAVPERSVHPAVHATTRHDIRIDGPLFHRGGRTVVTRVAGGAGFPRSKKLAMRLHHSGHGKSPSDRTGANGKHPIARACEEPTHRVREGDTLWSIAAEVLQTDDLRRIARYWPKIHRANRELLGPDPRLIFPDQLLVLPPECDV
jgi:nucleoid-associated protein YgaU